MMFETLKNESRLLMSVPLQPVQGSRFQPTGFPDLGAAEYQAGDTKMVLVESPQSMANRLELACWDETKGDWIEPLAGMPYVRVLDKEGKEMTNTVLEAHRLNSPYVVESDEFDEKIRPEIGFVKDAPFKRESLVKALLRYDVGSLMHGVFLEKVGGVVRLPRSISAFIEAENVGNVAAGGVKIDRVQPSTGGETTRYGKANEGYGNVPYHRDEYTGELKAYFNIDLAQIRGYRLGEAVENLLIGLSLFKVQRFLRDGLRLRTACDLEPKDEIKVKRPIGFEVPSLQSLEENMPGWIAAVQGFASPAVTEVTYRKA